MGFYFYDNTCFQTNCPNSRSTSVIRFHLHMNLLLIVKFQFWWCRSSKLAMKLVFIKGIQKLKIIFIIFLLHVFDDTSAKNDHNSFHSSKKILSAILYVTWLWFKWHMIYHMITKWLSVYVKRQTISCKRRPSTSLCPVIGVANAKCKVYFILDGWI